MQRGRLLRLPRSTAASPYLIYANEPYPDLSACADPTNGAQAPNGDAEADTEIGLFSHDANEAITDWAGAWMDSASYEDGDQCDFVYGVPEGVSGAYYNQMVNGHRYYTQDEFSNEDYALGKGDVTTAGGTVVPGCIGQEELPTASFTTPAAVDAGHSAMFDGSASSDPDASALTLGWNWGDGSAASQGAAPSHVFCPAGPYTVTLTVTDVDGWGPRLHRRSPSPRGILS